MILKQKQKHCKSSLIKVISSEKNSFPYVCIRSRPPAPRSPRNHPSPPPRRMVASLFERVGKGVNSGTQRRGFPLLFGITIEQITKKLIYLILLVYRNV